MEHLQRLPLHHLHDRQGATFGAYQGFELPSFYRGIQEEYEAATAGAALVDRSHTARLHLTGKDGLDLLHRLSTNDLLKLTPGTGAATVLTSEKGRVIELLTVIVLAPDHLLLVAGPGRSPVVAQWIDKFIFSEDAQIQDATQEYGLCYLFGPQAGAVLSGLMGASVQDLPLHHFLHTSLAQVEVLVARAVPLAGDAFYLTAKTEYLERVWSTLVHQGQEHSLAPVGEDVYEALRIEAGVPAPGLELTEEFNPWEARLDSAISLTKGCYVGQEVVARLHTYEKVQRQLVGLDLGQPRPDRGLSPGDKLLALEESGRYTDAGVITSAAFSPRLGRDIGLGYLRVRHAEPGKAVIALSGNGKSPVTVVALPFPR
jgi:folate-binding protein YgfZ